MRRVGAFIRDVGLQEAITQRLAHIATVEYFESPTSLIQSAATGALSAILSGLDGRRDSSIAPIMVDIAALAPSVPLVLYGTINQLSVGELRSIYAPGLSIDFVMHGAEPLANTVKSALDARLPPTAAPVLFDRFLGLAPPSLRPFLALLILKASSPRSVEQLASWIGITRRTVARRLQSAGWAESHVVRQSFRALDAIWLMTELGWSARQVAASRGVASPGGVGQLTYRYAGMRPSTVREVGGFWAALDIVQRRIVGSRPPIIPRYAEDVAE